MTPEDIQKIIDCYSQKYHDENIDNVRRMLIEKSITSDALGKTYIKFINETNLNKNHSKYNYMLELLNEMSKSLKQIE